jgi:hypothetical protein
MIQYEDDEDWSKIAMPQLLSAKHMVYLILTLEVIIQSLFLLLAEYSDVEVMSIAWWILQFNGLVVATNIGAVILAILAQKTANDIGKVQSRVLTPDFYRTVMAFTNLKVAVENEAGKDERSLDEEMQDLAPHMYSALRSYLISSSMAPLPAPGLEDLGVEPAPAEPDGGWTDEDLFS